MKDERNDTDRDCQACGKRAGNFESFEYDDETRGKSAPTLCVCEECRSNFQFDSGKELPPDDVLPADLYRGLAAWIEVEAQQLKACGKPDPEPESLRSALDAFIATIENTGGLMNVGPEEPTPRIDCLVPVADETWTDLADAYLNACKVLGRQPKIDTNPNPFAIQLKAQNRRTA
jgi:hypothetical protein